MTLMIRNTPGLPVAHTKAPGSAWVAQVRPLLRRYGPASAGYLMVEYLIYMAVLTVVMGVAFGAFYRCLTHSRDLARNTEDILQTLRAGELWRADIRAAVAPPEVINEGGMIAFEITKTQGLVAYVFADRSIWRSEGENPPQQIISKVRDSRLLQDRRGDVISWRWELELWTKKKNVRLKPLFTFQAVPGRGAT